MRKVLVIGACVALGGCNQYTPKLAAGVGAVLNASESLANVSQGNLELAYATIKVADGYFQIIAKRNKFSQTTINREAAIMKNVADWKANPPSNVWEVMGGAWTLIMDLTHVPGTP